MHASALLEEDNKQRASKKPKTEGTGNQLQNAEVKNPIARLVNSPIKKVRPFLANKEKVSSAVVQACENAIMQTLLHSLVSVDASLSVRCG